MTRKDPLDELTITELDSGSRLLKADLIAAITQHTPDRSRAMAVLAFLHERRQNPAAKLAPYMDMTYVDVVDELDRLVGNPPRAVGEDVDDQVDDDEPDPTVPAPAPS